VLYCAACCAIDKLQEDTLVIAAEEIDRLERELARMTRRYEKTSSRLKASEQSLGLLKVRVAELQTQRDELFLKKDLDTALKVSAFRADASRAKVQRRSSVSGPGVSGTATPLSSSALGSPAGSSAAPASASRRLSIGSTLFEFKDAVSPLGSNGGRSVVTADSAAAVPLETHQAAVETYRKREAELLQALEGVVKRCQELEGQSKIISNQ
jgi:hypothetical protein